jgi:hypothetical protein
VLRPRERVSSHCFLGNLRHPDITVHLLQINEDLIVGDAEIRSAEEGGGATNRVVEVLKSGEAVPADVWLPDPGAGPRCKDFRRV